MVPKLCKTLDEDKFYWLAADDITLFYAKANESLHMPTVSGYRSLLAVFLSILLVSFLRPSI